MPDALKEQLAVGGRMVLPVGTDDQWLYVIDRNENGFTERRCAAVRFVPLCRDSHEKALAFCAGASPRRLRDPSARARDRTHDAAARRGGAPAPAAPAAARATDSHAYREEGRHAGEHRAAVRARLSRPGRVEQHHQSESHRDRAGADARVAGRSGGDARCPAGPARHHAARAGGYADRGAAARQHDGSEGRATRGEGAVLRPHAGADERAGLRRIARRGHATRHARAVSHAADAGMCRHRPSHQRLQCELEKSAGTDNEDVDWMWPAKGKVLAPFTEASKGMDIAGKKGAPVLAAAGGRVVYAGEGLRGYGKLVIIKHNNTWLSAYAHNDNILVKEQQDVKKGQKIAEMGSTDSDQVMLHFEVRRQGKPVDPGEVPAGDVKLPRSAEV